MATTLPTVVFVHGAWHTPLIYQSYTDALRTRGFIVHCPRLPTCNGELPPNKSLPNDVACIRDVVLPLVEAGKRVIMVMHSYGGIVGTDAIEDLSLSERRTAGHQGGVIHLLYLCAYIVPPGGSVYNIVQQAGTEQQWPVFIENFDDGSTFPRNVPELFLNGVNGETIEEVQRHLVRHPVASFKAQTKGSGWRRIAATYVVTTQDRTVPTIYQDIMLNQVKREGVDLRIETYDTCHSVFLTKEKEMVELVVSVAMDERNLQ